MSLILAGTCSEVAVVLNASATARSIAMGLFFPRFQKLGSDSEKKSVVRAENLDETAKRGPCWLCGTALNRIWKEPRPAEEMKIRSSPVDCLGHKVDWQGEPVLDHGTVALL